MKIDTCWSQRSDSCSLSPPEGLAVLRCRLRTNFILTRTWDRGISSQRLARTGPKDRFFGNHSGFESDIVVPNSGVVSFILETRIVFIRHAVSTALALDQLVLDLMLTWSRIFVQFVLALLGRHRVLWWILRSSTDYDM